MKKSPSVQLVSPPLSGRRWLYCIYGAMAAALLWRLIVAWQIADGRFASVIFSPHPATDLRTYMELSKQVAAGEFSGPFYYQPFYYSVFLVLCRWLSNGSVWFVVIVQALLGAFTAGIAGVTAARTSGRTAGAVAAWLTALCTVLIFYTPFHQIATLQTFNIAVMTYYAVRCFQSSKYRYPVLLGILAAVGALTRGNVLLVFVPLLIALGIVKYKRSGLKKTFAVCALSLGCFLLAEMPFIVYNSVQTGRLCGPSTAADAVLALGNTPEAPAGGRDPGLPAGPMEYPQSYHVWMADKDKVPVINKIFDYMKNEPLAYLELTFRKLLLFWDHREIPNNVSLAGEGKTSRMLDFTVPVGVLLVLGLAGMFLMLKKLRKGSYLALYMIVIFYWGATAAFYNLSRFRSPILPVLAIFAGIFIELMRRRSQQKNWKYIRTYGVLSLLAAAFTCVIAYELYRNNLESAVIAQVRPQGTYLNLPDKRCVQFYHGPRTFGGWQGVESPVGTVLSVNFPDKRSEGSLPSEVRFSIQSQQPGVVKLNIGGTVIQTIFESPQYKEIDVALPEDFKGNTVNIKVLKNTCGAFFIADLQRFYQASKVNGELLPGELVVRLTR